MRGNKLEAVKEQILIAYLGLGIEGAQRSSWRVGCGSGKKVAKCQRFLTATPLRVCDSQKQLESGVWQ